MAHELNNKFVQDSLRRLSYVIFPLWPDITAVLDSDSRGLLKLIMLILASFNSFSLSLASLPNIAASRSKSRPPPEILTISLEIPLRPHNHIPQFVLPPSFTPSNTDDVVVSYCRVLHLWPMITSLAIPAWLYVTAMVVDCNTIAAAARSSSSSRRMV